jgi:hypothetical protein
MRRTFTFLMDQPTMKKHKLSFVSSVVKYSLTASVLSSSVLMAPSAHAFGMMLGTIMEQATKQTGKIFNKGMGELGLGEKPTNPAEAKAKFLTDYEEMLTGMGPKERKARMKEAESLWAAQEDILLMRNAQLYAEAKKPLFDIKEIAADVVRSQAGTLAMGHAVFGGGMGVADLVSTSALEGVADGLGGSKSQYSPTKAGIQASTMWANGMSGPSVQGQMLGAVSEKASDAISGTVASLFNVDPSTDTDIDVDFLADSEFSAQSFFGVPVADIRGDSFWGNAGMYGYKRVSGDDNSTTQVFVPVAGDPVIKAVVATFDKQKVATSAFYVLNVAPVSFRKVYDKITEIHGQKGEFQSSSNALRAVWPDARFVSADAKSLNLGWAAGFKSN